MSTERPGDTYDVSAYSIESLLASGKLKTFVRGDVG